MMMLDIDDIDETNCSPEYSNTQMNNSEHSADFDTQKLTKEEQM